MILKCLEFIQRFLKIRTKSGQIIPFVLNAPQKKLYSVIKEQWDAGKPVRIIILKARQMGFSTVTAAIIFWMVATAFNIEALVVAHKDDATRAIFQMYKRYLDNLPEPLKPMQRASNAQELVFDTPARYKGTRKGLGSKIRCATAGGDGIGRSYTEMALHLSELAFWPGDILDTMIGLLQTVPDLPHTLVVIESTANGYNEFKKQWDMAVEAQRAGTEGYIPVFFAWHEMPEYRRPVPPGFQRTEEEQQLAETFGLDDQQLAWRRWAIQTGCGGDINKFHQEYPSTPDEAFISTGSCVFDKAAIVLQRKKVQKLQWEYGRFRIRFDLAGKITQWEWVPEKNGPVRILEHPQENVPYVLGGDTAGTGSDWFAGHVIDNRTGKQVAVLHHQFGEREFTEQAYCLGMYYNQALIGLEVNYSTYPEKVLEELEYPNLYVRERPDTFTGDIIKAYGFETTTRTRPLIVDGLKDVAKQALDGILDYATLGEMLTFVYDENWKPQAENGAHDDLVMSLAITHFIRSQQSTTVQKVAGRGKQAHWSEDQWQDYYRASASEQEMLLKKWGNPF